MRRLEGITGYAIAGWSGLGSLFHLYFAYGGYLEPLRMRAFHLFMFVPLAFLLYPARPGRSPQDRPTAIDWLWALGCMLPSAYIYANAEHVYMRSDYLDPLSPLELGLGVFMTVAVLEGVRRAVAPELTVITVLTLVYMAVGHMMPGVWETRYFSFPHIIETVFINNNGNGIYGMLTGISANVVAIFVVFGAFVQASGTGRLFSNFGGAVAGRFAGGPAKVAVISSALFGTMSGSSVSNVATTGSITIPMMKRMGYRPALAGGIEAAASVGGALMPPVMGSAAFVMAEITNTPYSTIIVAAALGAVLYYAAILIAVDLEARKMGLAGLPADQVPRWRTVLADAHLILPVALLVYMLMGRWSPNLAACYATFAMIALSMLRPDTRLTPRKLLDALAEGGYVNALLALAVAAAGIITAALTNTGLVTSFGGLIKAAAGGQLWALAFLLMTMCLVLGMGVPTTPSYIITAAIGAPLITEYGVPLLAAHLFIFYFAILADATPPVAVAAYTAAAIAKTGPMITGVHATRLGIGGFVVGYAFLYDPAIMLRAPLVDIVASTVMYLAALTMVAAGFVGWFRVTLYLWARILFAGVGLLVAFSAGWPVWQRGLAGIVLLGVAWLSPRLFGAAPAPARAAAD
jgi:TRAP transporter 4TM/12TM fusion protein